MNSTTQRPAGLDPATLSLPLSGARLDGTETLGGLLQQPALLVFLRHGG